MPINVTVDVMLAKRKMSLNELSERVGVTAANLSILKTGKARGVCFSTLEVCEVLWTASLRTPLEYLPDQENH